MHSEGSNDRSRHRGGELYPRTGRRGLEPWSFLWLLLLPACSAPTPWVTPLVGQFKLDGEIHANVPDFLSVDTGYDDLGFSGTDIVPAVRAGLAFASSDLTVAAAATSFGGPGTVLGTLHFGDVEIPAGADVESQYDLTLARLQYTWDLPRLWAVEWGLGLGLLHLDQQIELRPLSGGEPGIDDVSVVVPLPALRVAWGTERWEICLEGLGLFLPLGADRVTVVDADLGAGYSFHESVQALVGLHYFQIGTKTESGSMSASTDSELIGWYLGVRFSF